MAESENSDETLARLAALDAAIARGLDGIESGRASSEVFGRLEARLAGTSNRTPSSKNPEH
ncbi:hypothetical protein JQ594_27020 [Bradyrhizobium manausense]|nr:hypothetical protein [Bradyrhizobium manausense]